MTRRNWSQAEVEATVESYIQMFKLELQGEKINKTKSRLILQKKLDARTEAAIELKHQNISAVLRDFELPCINGYKARGNYQQLLREVLEVFLAKDPKLLKMIKRDLEAEVEVPKVFDFKNFVQKPPRSLLARGVRAQASNQRSPLNINYVELEARKIELGDAGEKLILDYEVTRLTQAGKDHLARNVEHVAKTKGPSEGYDIRSYDLTGKDRFIEVKTTKNGNSYPFYITKNELSTSEKWSNKYYLYRVYNFRSMPQMFKLQGQIYKTCNIEPTVYKARPR